MCEVIRTFVRSGGSVVAGFETSLRENPGLRVVVVIPLVPDIAGWNRVPQLFGRERAVGDQQSDQHAGQHRAERGRLEHRRAPHRQDLSQCAFEAFAHLVVKTVREVDGGEARGRRLGVAEAVQHEQVAGARTSVAQIVWRDLNHLDDALLPGNRSD